MAATTQEILYPTQSELLSSERISSMVAGIDRENIAFGILYFPEKKMWKMIACTMDEMIPIHNPIDLKAFSSESGFVAFPFNPVMTTGYYIPNHLTVVELSEYRHKKSASKDSKKSLKETRSEHYQEAVQRTVDAIKENSFSKIVLSRRSEFVFNDDQISPFVSWLIQEYPEANISIFNIPGEGLWISASPEILLSFSPTEGVRSMALAGTRTFEPGFDEISLWSSKELEEQGIVTDFIREVFQEQGIRKLKEKGPYSVQAGNLIHLRTDFNACDGTSDDFYDLVNSLHPTTAVCGTPRLEAKSWIKNNEDFDRSFYSGFSGIVEPQLRKLVVNLRVANITAGMITLYAGAGITKASVPEKEWIETSEKLKTLGNFLTQGFEKST